MEEFIEKLLNSMTQEEKVQLCHGCTVFEAGDIPRLRIGKMGMADGPQGVRLEDGRKTTAFPCGISLSCTWDVDTAQRYGRFLGEEARGTGKYVLLGPGVNLMRTPLCGRNFEYFGEDPVLAGKIAAGYIKGVQEKRIAATIKHLAANNQEICRTTGNSIVDERTLREIYLRAFEIAVKEADPRAIMSAYNKINGIFASQHKQIQKDIVRDEWGYDGVIMSDWGGAHDTYGCAMGGQDLEMGQGQESIMGKPLLELIQQRRVPEEVIDGIVRRVLRLMYKTGIFDKEIPQGSYNTKEHHEAVKQMAQEGMVLLKNKDGFLPLNEREIRRVAVIGPNADFQHSMGPLQDCGGSGAVHPEYEVTPLQGIMNYLGDRAEITHIPGISFTMPSDVPEDILYSKDGQPGLEVEYFSSAEDMVKGRKPLLVMTESLDPIRQDGWFAEKRGQHFPGDTFAARWKGILVPEKTGSYHIGLRSNGKARMWLDEKLLINFWGDYEDMTAELAEFAFEAGKPVKIQIEYYDQIENAVLKLLWKLPIEIAFDKALEAARQSDVVLFFGGTNHSYDKEGGGWGNVPDVDIPDLELIGPQAELIQAIHKVNPRIAVVLINGSVVLTESWIERVPALLEAWYPGMEGGNAIAEVLFGKAYPGGKLSCTFGRRLEDYACHANGTYPGVREGENPFVEYKEGIFMGYRYFDRENIEPRFPFGYGLSYTSFEIRDCRIEQINNSTEQPEIIVTAVVRNTGSREGSEVVQVYVGDMAPSVERPVRELKAFAKVVLQPGEKKKVQFTLRFRDFAFWSTESKKWTIEPGTFRIEAGNSSRDFACTREIILQ